MPAMLRRFALVVALVAPAGVARADAAPPEDYVDPCASMKFEASCRRCSAPEFKSRECHEDARADGFVERCRGWNYAMYCKDGAATSPTPPTQPSPTPPTPPTPSEPPPADRGAPPPSPAPVQQPAPPPPPANATGGGCAIDGRGDAAGLALVLLLAVGVRRRRGSRR